MLCIYGEKDQEMSEYPGIVQKAIAESGDDDSVVRILQDAEHQLTITNGIRTYRDKGVDQFILDWVQERVREAH